MSKNSSERLREFHVGGMDCAGCARTVETALRRLDGVGEIQVDVMRGLVRVAPVEGRAVAPSDAAIARSIRDAGYSVRDMEPEAQVPRQTGRLVATALSGVLLGLGLVLGWTGGSALLSKSLLAVATLAGGWYVAPKGFRALRSGALDIHFLMTIAAIGAAVIGQWGEAAAAMFLFSVATWLEGYSVSRARRAIAALMELAPREATVRRGEADVVVPVGTVKVGETILVRPGERLPLDGVVLRGASAVDQSPITGESLPVDIEPGAEVFAGSINGFGSLEIEVSRHVEDTTLARILHAVEEAQASRAPAQSFVDRFAAIYTPAVVGLAALVAIVPPLLLSASWDVWIYRALALLVIACPCALVISTPVTIVSGLAGAARAGVLLKGGAQMEALGRVTAVAFDKTGTLTEGTPAVTDVVPLDGQDADEVLRLAAGVERHSEHPVGRAIVARAREQSLLVPEPVGFAASSGSGARADVEGRTLWIGNTRVCRELGNCHAGAHSAIDGFARDGKTGILLTTAQEPVGVIAIADRIRPDARRAVAALHAAGIRRVAMLTGDHEAVARAVAADVGIDDVRFGLLPSQKQEAVAAMQAEGERVAVVGDGVNDAPALAAADVGIAMGAAGSHVALETADVALMGDDLGQIAATIRRSRRVLSIIRANIAFAIVIKAVFLVLAITGYATLWMAVAADTGASLVVVANGLRAMR